MPSHLTELVSEDRPRHIPDGKALGNHLLEVNRRLDGFSYFRRWNGVCLLRVIHALLSGKPLSELALPAPEHRRNFALSFRETIVGGWVANEGAIAETPSRLTVFPPESRGSGAFSAGPTGDWAAISGGKIGVAGVGRLR